ncbi:NADP-dependent isocitrate dehydrogenase [Deinococcus pimensis]|uniref:NADP-dependent isocitrate dehydrogenase n=1 Tax=Deinococcus pimensis TaxID=309888 RepID=UPI0004B95A37|nr:NADP-dependent isocitrate dehydrogenase [Deinococcus pimensis]
MTDTTNPTARAAEQHHQAPLVPVAVAYGDGIGPEIMRATLRVLEAAGARIETHEIEVGESVYLRGVSSGIGEDAWDVLRRTGVLLKAPITTPQGGGYKSLNVTMRKTLGLYANVRPTRALAPFVPTTHPDMDLVIVRENEEDLYAGIEHRQTREVYQCLKIVTRDGCERIVRYAFEYARAHGRKRVTCLTKDNIMKFTDGLFHAVFDEVAAEYPDVAHDHMIIDIGTARVATRPEKFDVIVTLNLYGDILSDVAAEVAGSVGLAGSSNVGLHAAMFEAVHGSAPDIAGRDIANPSGLLNAATLMLTHVGQQDVAATIQNAWLRTLEDGMHTADIAGERTKQVLGTQAFADAVIERLGQTPQVLTAAAAGESGRIRLDVPKKRAPIAKRLVGVDVFLDWDDADRKPDVLGERLSAAATAGLRLTMISNRGVKVWPHGHEETTLTDHWRCRFEGSGDVTNRDVLALLASVEAAGLEFVKTEGLYEFDGKPGYSMGQGQ